MIKNGSDNLLFIFGCKGKGTSFISQFEMKVCETGEPPVKT